MGVTLAVAAQDVRDSILDLFGGRSLPGSGNSALAEPVMLTVGARGVDHGVGGSESLACAVE